MVVGGNRNLRYHQRKPYHRNRRASRKELRQEILEEREQGVERLTLQRNNIDQRLPVYLQPNEDYYGLIKEDYDSMFSHNVIEVTPNVKRLMLMQSIPGHAASGHGKFAKRARYINSHMGDVLKALKVSPARIAGERQELIDDIHEYATRFFKDPADKNLTRLVNANGEPLAGATMLFDEEVDPFGVIIGMYLGSTMDNYDTWRRRVHDRFKLQMGGGRNYALNLSKMRKYNLTLEMLSTEEHSPDQIADLIKKGIAIDRKRVEPDENVMSGYIRIVRGKGVSDDAAVLTAGIQYGRSAALGLFLIDAVDTWDKFTPMIHRFGQDELLGQIIQEGCNKKGIEYPSRERVEEFIFLSAIDPMRATLYPDCSQRRFLLKEYRDDPNDPTFAMQLHLNMIERMRDKKSLKGVGRLKLGYRGADSRSFYDKYIQRWNTAVNNNQVLAEKIGYK